MSLKCSERYFWKSRYLVTTLYSLRSRLYLARFLQISRLVTIFVAEQSQTRPVQDENVSVAVADHVDAGTLADGLQPDQEPLEAFSWRDCGKKSFSDNIKHLPLSGVIFPHVQLDLFPVK